MTTPEQRWQQLIAVARTAPVQRAALSDFHAAKLAAHGLSARRQPAQLDLTWRGFAAAGTIFIGCLLSLGALGTMSNAFDDQVNVTQTLTQFVRSVPSTSFIPQPPRPPTLTATISAWSPTKLVDSFTTWVAPTSTTEFNP
jgi:hypothetical protein